MTELKINFKHCGGETRDFAELLLNMYCKWCEKHNLNFDVLCDDYSFKLKVTGGEQLAQEHGVHRLVFTPPLKTNRYTVFCRVDVDELEIANVFNNNIIRGYILDPYKRVVNYVSGTDTKEVDEVLNGNLELIWPKQ
jgi:hypothetical protein